MSVLPLSFKTFRWIDFAKIRFYRILDYILVKKFLLNKNSWKIRPCGMVSSSHYVVNNVDVTAKMGDMVDFFLLHYYFVEEEPRRIAYAVMP